MPKLSEKMWRAGLLSSHSAQASHCSGCCCRARAPGRAGFNGCGACAQQWLPGSRAQARQLCFMGLVAPWHVRFPLNQGWNSCLLPWQAESYPLSHQEVLTLPSEGRLKASQAGAQVCGRSGRDRGRVHNPPQKWTVGICVHHICQPGHTQRQLLIPRGIIQIR